MAQISFTDEPSAYEMLTKLKEELEGRIIPQLGKKEYAASAWNYRLIATEIILNILIVSFAYSQFKYHNFAFGFPVVALWAAMNIIVVAMHAVGKFESHAFLLKDYRAKANILVAEATKQINSVARDTKQTPEAQRFKEQYSVFVELVSKHLNELNSANPHGKS